MNLHKEIYFEDEIFQPMVAHAILGLRAGPLEMGFGRSTGEDVPIYSEARLLS